MSIAMTAEQINGSEDGRAQRAGGVVSARPGRGHAEPSHWGQAHPEQSDAATAGALAHVRADGRRPRLARALCASGLMPLTARLRAAWRDDLRILAYHRVLPLAEPAGFRFDPDLISASAEALSRAQCLARSGHRPFT